MVSILGRDREGRVTIFVARISNGALVLVHPIRQKNQLFMPCCFGYATTIRRAQGSSHHLGALYFDHCYPPERGYGYVGASRFRSSRGLYFYGRVRRTDWLPVGAMKPDEQTRRSFDSQSSESGCWESDNESLSSERAESSSASSMAFGEDPDDFPSDEDSMPDRDYDHNYLDREGNLSGSDADREDNLSGSDADREDNLFCCDASDSDY